MKKLILLAVILALSCGKKPDAGKIKIAPKQYSGVILTNDTAVRIDPFIFSARVSQLRKGETVDITDRSGEKSAVGGSADYWYKISNSKGLSGWVYGKNIQILESNKNTVDSFVSNFWEKEKETVRKNIIGRWWSVNKFGDFTNHVLEFNEGGTYKSYAKGGEAKPIQGGYNLDFTNNEIIFISGTTFGKNLDITIRGETLILSKDTDKGEILFKKIKVGSNHEHDDINSETEGKDAKAK